MKELWTLFWTFAKMGVMTFGGGMAMLPILQREVVESKHWATEEELTLPELKAASDLFEEDVYDALNLENCMALRNSYGGPAVAETTRQIAEMEDFIQAHTK